MNEGRGFGSFLTQFPIKARLITLAVVLLLAMVVSSLYIRAALYQALTLSENASHVAENIETVVTLRSAFDDLRYWQTDLAVSQLTLAERNAADARTRFAKILKQLAVTRPDDAQKIEALATQFDDLAGKAVDAYTDNERVVGNANFAQARQFGVQVDDPFGMK